VVVIRVAEEGQYLTGPGKFDYFVAIQPAAVLHKTKIRRP
jgi:hypothetical protein